MPGIAHFIFGLFIVIPIMIIAKDRFNYKVAIIFVLANYLGPDAYWAFRYIPFNMHALLGYAIWAIPLALLYSYLSRFSIKTSGHFFKVVDDRKYEVNWRNAYLLCIAGGITHTMIDFLFHHGMGFNLLDLSDILGSGWDPFGIWSITFQEVLNFGESLFSWGSTLIILGFVIMTLTFVLIIFILGRNTKERLIFLFAAIGLITLNFFTLGTDIFGGELDMSAIFFMLLFLFVPLIILAYVSKNVHDKPADTIKPHRLSPKTRLKIISAVYTAVTGIFMILGFLVLIFNELLTNLIGEMLSPLVVMVIAIVVIILAGIGLGGGIGLFFKVNACRYIAMFFSILLIFFVFPFGILLFLNESEIKELFVKKSNG